MTTETQTEEVLTIPPEFLPKVDHLITEDDTPVDNMFSAKQQRLLVEPLYSSWMGGSARRAFIADANVGLFASDRQPALVPDAFLSLDVQLPADLWPKEHRSYFFWLYGKPPEVVIEVVSNRKGNELESKLQEYARMRIFYYVVFDPEEQLKSGLLNAFSLHPQGYQALSSHWMPEIGLGLTLWHGVYETVAATWLRWCDQDGNVIPTGAERAEQERQRAEAEHQRAEAERQRVEETESLLEAERQRAEQLRAQLRAMGIDPQL